MKKNILLDLFDILLHISLIVENWIQILLGIVIAITLTVLILLVVLLVLKLRSGRKKVGSRNFLNESISMGQVSPTHQVMYIQTCVLQTTECVTDLDYQSKMIIFELIFTTFEASVIFWGSWGSIENQLESKTKPPFAILDCPNLWNALYDHLWDHTVVAVVDQPSLFRGYINAIKILNGAPKMVVVVGRLSLLGGGLLLRFDCTDTLGYNDPDVNSFTIPGPKINNICMT